MTQSPEQREALRLARFIGSASAAITAAAGGEKILVEHEERGAIAVSKALLLHMVRVRLLETRGKDRVALTEMGRSLAGGPPRSDVVPEGRGEIALVDLGAPGESQVLIDLDESPLAQLARRKGRDGRPFLDSSEVGAGERLRADYTRGQVMPRMGANWIASVSTGRRDGSGGMADLTDAALAARQRVEKAIRAVGPELSGVLVDVCCYLKGLERVEAERSWPARSAKIVLKTALGVLSRHYDPSRNERRAPRLLHWGAEDFRPSMDGR